MADSLDDFFAKKDKKRGKQKVGVISAETLVKELEEGAKQVEYSVRKDKTSAAIEILGLDADDGDWRDFEDVEKRDYTGLKVKEMSLQDQTDVDNKRLASDQADSAPDPVAWKIKEDPTPTAPATNSSEASSNKQPTQSKDPTETSAKIASDTDKASKTAENEEKSDGSSKVEAETAGAASSSDKPGDTVKPVEKYVPPHERNRGPTYAQAGEGCNQLAPQKMSMIRNKGSPYGTKIDIQDEAAFPTLG